MAMMTMRRDNMDTMNTDTWTTTSTTSSTAVLVLIWVRADGREHAIILRDRAITVHEVNCDTSTIASTNSSTTTYHVSALL
eukprot:COSAG02_NODE_293_length_25438_cov_52.630254_7_plen_81_part_00